MKVSLIINSYNEGPDLARTIESFRAHAGDCELSVVVVADGTTDGSADQLPDEVLVLKPTERLGCGGAKALAVRWALDRFAPDVIIHSDGHGRVVQGSVREIADIAIERAPCVITPMVGPLNCAKASGCSNYDRRGICEQTCPEIEDDLRVPRNCYTGGEITWRTSRGEPGVQVENYCDRPTEAVQRTSAVNPSLFCYTPDTLRRIGGWNEYPGWWGFQELGLSLRCWYSGTPIYIARDVVMLHRYRSWNRSDGKALATYEVPDGHREANERYCLRVVSDDETWDEVWKPHFARDGFEELARPFLEGCKIEEQHKAFLALKKRTDREFFQECLKMPFPLGWQVSESASRGLYLVSAGIGNALMCLPAMKALAMLSGGPIDVAFWKVHRKEQTREILELQPFIRKVLEEIPDLTHYRRVAGSFTSGLPPFAPKGCAMAGASKSWRTRHEVECNMDALRALGYEGPVPGIELEGWKEPEIELGPNPVALGTQCAGMLRKRWPHWEALARMLAEAKVDCVFVGDRDADEPWMDAVGVNLCGKTSFGELAGVLLRCRLYVGIDNGPAHLAAAVRTPSIVLFGPSQERKSAPWASASTILRAEEFGCAPCWDTPKEAECERQYPEAKPCMAAIPPEWVLREVLRQLNRAAWEAAAPRQLVHSLRQRVLNDGGDIAQNMAEFGELVALLRRKRVRRIVEIGCSRGGWISCLARALGPPLDILLVDPQDAEVKDSHPELLPAVVERLRNEGHRIALLARPSDEAAAEGLAWAGGGADLLHIDGGHSADQVMRDWLNYAPALRRGGLVVFHDIASRHETGPGPVFDAVARASGRRSWRFVEERDTRMGIGVVQM